jgi:ABC-type multidrug transport system fused ATPase/permease subunit
MSDKTVNISLYSKLNYLLEKKYKKQIIILSLLLFIGILFEMLSLGLLIPAFGLMVKPNLFNNYNILKPILKFFGNPNQKELIIGGMIFIVFIYSIKSFFLILLTWKQSTFSNNVTTNLSKRLFEGYLHQPYLFHLNTNTSILLRNLQNDIAGFTAVAQNTITILLEFSILIGIAFILILTEPIGAISISLYLLLASFIFQKITKVKLTNLGKDKQNVASYVNKYLLQGLSGVKDIKIFGREKFFTNQFSQHNVIFSKIITKIYTLTMIPRLYLELLSISGLAGLVISIVVQDKPIDFIITTMGIFAAASYRMIPSVNRILSSMQIIRSSKPSIDNLYLEFKSIEKTETSFHVTRTVSKLLKFENQIEIKNINYFYTNTHKPALKNINLIIKKGDFIGIVGPSGSGKSTFIDILLGLLQPSKGEILIDDYNISIDIRNWQKSIGYVPQNIYLIDDTIKANIAFGISNDNISDELLEKCIKSAQLFDFINNLDKGINTIVGERGARLSGGQRQRIGIARALYHNPDVLILDEATSSLDNDTETKIMYDINKLKGLKTIILIAHRTSTLKMCDKIIKFHNSEIIG